VERPRFFFGSLWGVVPGDREDRLFGLPMRAKMGFSGDGVDIDATEAREESGESYFDGSNNVNVISVGMMA
jgi:hypothetical protein